MPFFEEKPRVVEAYQLQEDNIPEVIDWIETVINNVSQFGPVKVWWDSREVKISIPNLSGRTTASFGDWIVNDPNQSALYAWKPDVFETTYRPTTPTQDEPK